MPTESELFKPSMQKYSDIDMDFRMNPINNDVLRLNHDQSIAQSVRNLVRIMFYEKHFVPGIGNFAAGALFENIGNTIVLDSVRDSISEMIRRFEPRVRVNNVNVSDTTAIDQNRISVMIEYTIIGKTAPANIEVMIRRVR